MTVAKGSTLANFFSTANIGKSTAIRSKVKFSAKSVLTNERNIKKKSRVKPAKSRAQVRGTLTKKKINLHSMHKKTLCR